MSNPSGRSCAKNCANLGLSKDKICFFEFRSAEEKLDLLPKLAAELVGLKVDVIVALYTPCAIAAKQATRGIPIVIMSGDALGTGLVPSLVVRAETSPGCP